MCCFLFTLPWLCWAVVRISGVAGPIELVQAIGFTPYVAATSLLPVFVAVLARRWLAVIPAVLACACLLAVTVPRALPFSPEAPSGLRATVMTLNTRLGEANVRDIARLVRERSVDVLVLQEVTPSLNARLMSKDLKKALPHRESLYEDYGGRSLVLSSHPLRRVRKLPGTKQEALRVERIEVSLDVRGRPVDLTLVHPPSPTNAYKASLWRTELHRLASGPQQEGRPTVMLGDFNATLDHRELRAILDSGYVDAADTVGAGLRTTFRLRPLPPLTIDHVLVTPEFAVARLDVKAIAGTDHKAVIAELSLER